LIIVSEVDVFLGLSLGFSGLWLINFSSASNVCKTLIPFSWLIKSFGEKMLFFYWRKNWLLIKIENETSIKIKLKKIKYRIRKKKKNQNNGRNLQLIFPWKKI